MPRLGSQLTLNQALCKAHNKNHWLKVKVKRMSLSIKGKVSYFLQPVIKQKYILKMVTKERNPMPRGNDPRPNDNPVPSTPNEPAVEPQNN